MEKRSCSGIARVTPSSHIGPSMQPTSSSAAGRKTPLFQVISAGILCFFMFSIWMYISMKHLCGSKVRGCA